MKQFELQTAECESDNELIEGHYLCTARPATLSEATETFMALEQVKKQTFIAQGFILRVVQDDCLYQDAGYVDIYSYAKGTLGIKDDSTVNRYININKRFSIGGYSQDIKDKYMNYKYSALQEIWKMSDEEIEEAGITETTTVAKIREIKKEIREENEPEQPEQLSGQMNIADFIPATSQKKSDFKNRIYENDGGLYNWRAKEITKKLFEKYNGAGIDELSGFEYKWAGISFRTEVEDEYIAFYQTREKEVDFKVNIERLKTEYENYKETNEISQKDDNVSEIQESVLKQSESVSNQQENVSKQPESDSKLDSMAAVEMPEHFESEYMTAEMPEGLFQEIALDIVSGIIEDNDAETAERILTHENEFIEFIHDISDNDPWQQSYIEGRLFNYSTNKDSIFLDIHELDIDTEHELGIGFGISLDELYETAFEIYKKVYLKDSKEELDNKELYQTLDYQAKRVYEKLNEEQKELVRNKKQKELMESLKDRFGKTYSGSGGSGEAFIDFSPKGIVFEFQYDKIRTYKEIAEALIKYIIFDNEEETNEEETVVAEVISTKKDILHIDIDLEKYDINAPKEEKIRTVFKCVNKELANITQKDVKAFNYAIDFIGATNKALVLLDKEKTEKENPKPEEPKHEEQYEKESQRQQEALQELKNNGERRAWLEDYENWPVWIDNKETQERYYRYNFENGDAFVIKVYFSNIPCYNYITRKMEKTPHWGREEYYILEKESDKTFSDSKSTTTAMIDYLKNMQKKG